MICRRRIAGALLVAAVVLVAGGSQATRSPEARSPRSSRGPSGGGGPPAPVPELAEPEDGGGARGLRAPADWAAAVAAENARPGSPGWQVRAGRGTAPGLAAYADRVSVRPGERVGLYVDGRGEVSVEALRIGFYGGAGARLVWAGRLLARPQPAPVALVSPIPDAGGLTGARAVVAPWRQSALVDTTGWPEGDYLLRLDAGRASRLVPLVVRSVEARGRVLLVAGALTWQAYNVWGGRSLYQGPDGGFASRSYAVSFDRPYSDGYGSGRFEEFDAPIARRAEEAGLPLAWASDYDVATSPQLLDGAAAVVVGGHQEYWTAAMRDAVTRAVARGTNLAVLGANTAYWRVRLAGRTIGLPGAPGRRDGRPRIVVGPKQAERDPLALSDPGGATARFRDPPFPRLEERLTGMRYDCFPAEAPWRVADPSWWGYAGTGVRRGQELAGLVGPESDRVYPAASRPRPMTVVAYSRFACRAGVTAHTAVYWVASSGAGVFATGTMRWSCALADSCPRVPDPRARRIVVQVTRNVLEAFRLPRAGLRHPARDDVARYPLPYWNTTGAA